MSKLIGALVAVIVLGAAVLYERARRSLGHRGAWPLLAFLAVGGALTAAWGLWTGAVTFAAAGAGLCLFAVLQQVRLVRRNRD